MRTIGVDAHKRIHMAVAIDNAGRAIARWRGPNRMAGWEQLAQWGADLDQPRRWGIEGAWNDGRGLAQRLIARGGKIKTIALMRAPLPSSCGGKQRPCRA